MDGGMWIKPLSALLAGYLLGSIPFGLLLARAGGAGDLRAIGSGNIGATNVLRTGHKGLALATLVLDGGKGALAVWVGGVLLAWQMGGFGDLQALANGANLGAVGAFLGHLYPIWLRGRGGKGVATLLGIALALSLHCGLVALVMWLGLWRLTRYSSVGGMAAAMSLPVAAAVFGRFELVLLFLALALMVLWKHGDNIGRLLAGTEPHTGENAEDAG